ncbi:hypothetical protein ACQP1K_04290 [Sphaerimonospora sp. CA-214678]|uniref:hypothetical protein n=1 Tax=Sphaerimonospora sp. CA-214678 TaxID=3240029 RepID=UPI003D91834B
MGNIGAERFLPAEQNLPVPTGAARRRRSCDLHRNAARTVAGKGVPDARFMLAGERPGDQADRRGACYAATTHPSAIPRAPDRDTASAGFPADPRAVART